MIFDFTEQEQKEINLLEAKYEKLIKAAQDRIDELSEKYQYPETAALFDDIDPDNHEEWERANKEETRILDEWFQTVPEDWNKAVDDYSALIDELNNKRRNLFAICERRSFSEIGKDKLIILNHAREQINLLLEAKDPYFNTEAIQSVLSVYREVEINPGAADPNKLMRERTKERVKGALHLHYDALKKDKDLTDQLNQFIDDAINITLEGASAYLGGDTLKGTRLIKMDLNLHFEGEKVQRVARKRPSVNLPKDHSVMTNPPMVYYALQSSIDLRKPPISTTRRIKINRRTTLDGQLMFDFKNGSEIITVTYDASIQNKKSLSGMARRLFIYALIKGNNQNFKDNRAYFNIFSLMDLMGIEDNKNKRDYTRQQILAAAEELKTQKIERRAEGNYKGRKINRIGSGYIVTWSEIEQYSGECFIEFQPAYVDALLSDHYYSILPDWSVSIKNDAAFDLTYKVYTQMGIEGKNTINLNNRIVASWAGLPSKKEDVPNYKYKEKVLKPIEEIFDEIEKHSEYQVEIYQSEDYNLDNIDAFFRGYTQFIVNGEAGEYWDKRKKIKEENKRKAIASARSHKEKKEQKV